MMAQTGFTRRCKVAAVGYKDNCTNHRSPHYMRMKSSWSLEVSSGRTKSAVVGAIGANSVCNRANVAIYGQLRADVNFLGGLVQIGLHCRYPFVNSGRVPRSSIPDTLADNDTHALACRSRLCNHANVPHNQTVTSQGSITSNPVLYRGKNCAILHTAKTEQAKIAVLP